MGTTWLNRRQRAALALAALAGLGLGTAQAETDAEYCARQLGSARAACERTLKNAPAAASTTSAGTSAALDADRAYCERQTGAVKTVCLRELAKQPTKPAATATVPSTPAKAAAGPAPAPTAAVPATATADGAPLYRVVDGYHVDANTLQGFKTWRAAACDRCHGANQEGMVGPSLINSLKLLSKAQFVQTVTEGRLVKGMPSFGGNPVVAKNIDALYAYLKGRSDGAITKAHVQPMP